MHIWKDNTKKQILKVAKTHFSAEICTRFLGCTCWFSFFNLRNQLWNYWGCHRPAPWETLNNGGKWMDVCVHVCLPSVDGAKREPAEFQCHCPKSLAHCLESEPDWRDPCLTQSGERLQLGESRKERKKERKGNVGERSEPTFCQRRRLLDLKPGKQGKPRLSSA